MWSTTTWNIRDTAQANLTIWWTMNPMYQPIDLRMSRLTVAPHRLFRRDGHGHVDIGGPVHQGQGLAQAGLALQPHRRELEEELVELALQTRREVTRGPAPPDLGVDLGHHLVQVLRPGRSVHPVGIADGAGSTGATGGVGTTALAAQR